MVTNTPVYRFYKDLLQLMLQEQYEDALMMVTTITGSREATQSVAYIIDHELQKTTGNADILLE